MARRYRELYEEGRRMLEAAGLPDAALDARLLLEGVCGTQLQTLLVYPDLPVEEESCARYGDWIGRRLRREPTAMILGEWDFMGLTFKVTRDTLIPEQDTEVLAETALELFGKGKAPRVLDLCTGSGCILLSLLHFLPDAEGIGTDLSEGALTAAAENADRLGLASRCRFLRGDLWEALRGVAAAPFDLIVSNPPYVPTDVIATLEPEVRCGEPYAALDGGPDGLAFYRRILKETGRYLRAGGWILLETGFDEAAAVTAMMRETGFAELRVVKDYGGLDRVAAGRLPLN